MQTRRVPLVSLAVLAALGLVRPAQAQGWPQKPVRIVVPYAPGGNTDGIARIVAQRLGEVFGQQFIIDNRTGAGGAIAAETVARSPADGYTLFVTAMAILAIVPAMTKTSYDPVNDFAPISNIGTNPLVLVTHPSFPAKTIAEFVAYVRTQPQKLTYAASNIGSLAHLSMELFLKRAGHPCAIQGRWGGAADRRHRRSPPYVLRTLVRRGTAQDQRCAAAARGIERKARPANPRRSDLERVGISGIPDAHLERSDGARGNAQGDHRPDCERGIPRREGPEACRALSQPRC
jgi:hypothetical protein